jgi:hypothetical protein
MPVDKKILFTLEKNTTVWADLLTFPPLKVSIHDRLSLA